MTEKLSIFLTTIFFALVIFVPIFLTPTIILGRNNDLTEFFVPLLHFIKVNIAQGRGLPLTNTMFFMGTPLLPDPQNPVWYLPNIIFLGTSVTTGIIVSAFLHTISGGIGMYLVGKRVFNFKYLPAFFATGLYMFSARYFAQLEAGHWGLVIAYSWLPYFILAVHLLITKPTFLSSLFVAVAFAALYINHLPTALIAILAMTIYWIINSQQSPNLKKSFLASLLAGAMFLGICAVFILPQVEWQRVSTRGLLLQSPELFPIWNGKRDFIQSLFLNNPDTEKFIALGFVPIALSAIGFLTLKKRTQLIIICALLVVLAIVLNNVSPVLPVLTRIDFLVVLRVTTRFWFIALFLFIYLAGKGLDQIVMRSKMVTMVLIALAFGQLLLMGRSHLLKKIPVRNYVDPIIYQVFDKDKSIYRVFCPTRCIPQSEAALHNLQLVEGYGTLQQTNYYNEVQQITGRLWRNYTLSIPPFDVLLYEEINPSPTVLAIHNIKYVISNHKLPNKDYDLIETYGNFLLYKNKLWHSPPYLTFSPNLVQVDLGEATSIPLPIIYSPGWQANYLNTRLEITEGPNSQLTIANPGIKGPVDLTYNPIGYQYGKYISLISVLGVITYLIITRVNFIKAR